MEVPEEASREGFQTNQVFPTPCGISKLFFLPREGFRVGRKGR